MKMSLFTSSLLVCFVACILASPSLWAASQQDVFKFISDRVSQERTVVNGIQDSTGKDCRLEIRYYPERIIGNTFHVYPKFRVNLSVSEPDQLRVAGFELDQNIPETFEFKKAEIKGGTLKAMVDFNAPEIYSRDGRDSLSFVDSGSVWKIRVLKQHKGLFRLKTISDLSCSFARK